MNSNIENLQIPFSWTYSLLSSKEIQLNWDKQTKRQSAPFRITIAADLKEVCILKVTRSKTKQPIAIIDVRFATYLQVYETPILTKYLSEVIKQGIIIKKKEGLQEAYIFIPTIAAVIWFSIFANSAFDIISIGDKTQFNNVFSSLFIFLEHFPFHFVTFFIAGLMVLISIINSIDSAIFVLGMFSDNGNENPSKRHKLG